MTFNQAVYLCKVRGYIARTSEPEKMYAYNHEKSLFRRVPVEDQKADDWETYDPEAEETSIIG